MIKQILGAFLICLIAIGCSKVEEKKDEVADTPKEEVTPEKQESKFGIDFEMSNAITLASLQSEMESADSLDCVVKGTVAEVCQKKGCWMTLKKEDGSTIRVTFKDYALFMPKDLAGKEIALHGVAKAKTESVEMLKHLAEDQGKSQDEIDAITEPETKLAIVADGVVIN